MRMLSNDTDVTPNQGATSGSQAVQVGGKQIRAAAAAALPGAARHGLDEPRRAGRRTSRSRRASSRGGGKTVTYGELVGGKLFNVTIRRRTASHRYRRPPAGPTPAPVSLRAPRDEAGEPVQAGRDRPGPAAARHPGEGDRHLHLRPQHPRPRHAARRGSSGRAARARTATARTRRCCRSIQLDQPHPGRQGLQKGNFVGVVAPKEYDAIQAAAQLKVTWAAMP